MSKKIKKILFLVLIFMIASFTLKFILDKIYLNEYNVSKLVGSNRYESMVKINNERWKKSDEAVLVNIHSISDSISTAPFAYAKDIPMFFTEAYKLDDVIKKEFKKLGIKKVYLIGGNQSINENVEKSINKMGISTERIFGENSLDTSLVLANKLCELKDVKELVVVNNGEGRVDGVAMVSPASKNNMAIIPIKKKGRSQLKNFIKEQDIKKTYFIGNEEQFPQEFLDTIPNSVRISGKDRYDTNIQIIKEFYDLENINKVYMTKDGKDNKIDFINTLSLSTIAAKQDIPILFNSQSLGKQQKAFLQEIGVKDITEVGFELVRPRLINPKTTRVTSCLAIVGIWIVAIRRIIYS